MYREFENGLEIFHLTSHGPRYLPCKNENRKKTKRRIHAYRENFSDAVRPNYAIYCVLAFSICQDGFSVFVGDMTAARLSRVKEQVVYN